MSERESLMILTPWNGPPDKFGADSRRKWSNPEILFNDCGLRVEFLDEKIVELIFGIVKASLSETGFKKVRDAMRTNHFLGELVNAKPILNELSYKSPFPIIMLKVVFFSLERQGRRHLGDGVFMAIIYV